MNMRALLIAFLLLPLLAHAGSGVLREDTATQVAIGPFLDGTDGVTAETALTVTEWDCDLVKHANSSMAATSITITASGGSNDAAHLQSGIYSLELTATDTNTAGRLILICDHATPTTFMPVRHEWMVMPTQEYDSLYGTDVQQVHVVEFTANVIDAASLAADAGTEIGTATWASATRTLTAATNITSTGGTTVPQTGDSFARIGAPVGASLSADLQVVDGNVDAILVDTGTTLDGYLTALLRQIHTTTIATLASQTSFTLTAGSADNDAYNGWEIIVTDQSTSTQKAVGMVQDYVGSTRTVTLMVDPGVFTMATGDTVTLRPANANVRQINCYEVTADGTIGTEWAGTGDGGC